MIKILDIQGMEIKIGSIVNDIFGDEVAKVVDILENENKIRIQYFGEENFLNGDLLECNGEEVELLKLKEG